MGMEIKRGDVVLVNLNPVKGSEQGGIRPCLVIQNNLGNRYSPTTIIAPITSKKFNKEFPTNVSLLKEDSGLDRDSTALLNQVTTIDKRRIIKRMGFLNEEMMAKVDLALKISLNIN